MFKKLMAKIGVGSATVDLRLDKDAYRLGETMTGTIHISGGNVEQRISDLSVVLMMKAYVKGQAITRPVQSIPVLHGFTVQPKPFAQEVPFSYVIPNDLALSTHSIHYYLHTKLDVELALDPTDMDAVRVLPPAHIEKVFASLDALAFRQKPDSGKLTPYGQEFSFIPTRPLPVALRELEVIFFESPEGLRLLVEFDIAQHGFFRREVERKAEIVIPREYLEDGAEGELTRYLSEKIETYLTHPEAIPYFSLASYRHGHRGHHSHGMGSMIGGMAVGLLGGMLIGEMMSEAGELLGVDDMFDGGGDGGDGGDFGGFGDFDL